MDSVDLSLDAVFNILEGWENLFDCRNCISDLGRMREELRYMRDNMACVAGKLRAQETSQAAMSEQDQWKKEEQRQLQEAQLAERQAALEQAVVQQEARERAWQEARAQREQEAAAWQRQEEEQRQRLEDLRQQTAAADRALEAAVERQQEQERLDQQKARSLANWEAALKEERSLREERQTALHLLGQIQAAMTETQRAIRQLGPNFSTVMECVNGGYVAGGLKNLIRCCRSLRQANTTETDYYAKELEWVLLNNFGCQQIVPASGASFDALTMAWQDAAAGGSRVARTVYCGWMLGDSILEKAIIIPETEV